VKSVTVESCTFVTGYLLTKKQYAGVGLLYL